MRVRVLVTPACILDTHADKLHARAKPYEWSLLHAAAEKGHLAVVGELLKRGLDVNTREKGDNTYAMHWAAAAGHLDVIRRLADAGGDVVGHGDDHQGEVIGWATCWPGSDDDAHRAVADFLVSRGARYHIVSAIAMNLADEVRRIVADDPAALNRRQSRNENHRTPLHFALLMNRREMIGLLLELGADPLAVDGSGQPVAFYAGTPDADRQVMEKVRTMVSAEFVSAARGHRPSRGGPMDLVALLALGDWDRAAHLLRENTALIDSGGVALHLIAQRNDVAAVKWLLAHGACINGRWSSQGAEVTSLHLAAARGHAEMVQLLLGPAPIRASATACTKATQSAGPNISSSRRSSSFSKTTRRTLDDPVIGTNQYAHQRRRFVPISSVVNRPTRSRGSISGLEQTLPTAVVDRVRANAGEPGGNRARKARPQADA